MTTHPRPTLLRALACSGLALATGLTLAQPAAAASPDLRRASGEEQVFRQVSEAARTASAQRIKQRSTPPGHATPTTDALDAALRDVVSKGAIAVTARVETPELTWRGSAGLRDKDGRAPAQPQDRFRIASQTKLMVATLVMQEVERGTWRLDQRVDEVIPGLFPGHEYVTFRQLLSHTSGAPNGTAELFARGYYFDRDYTAQEHIDVLNASAWNPPGTPLYSNGGYIALGMLLEAQNGRPVGQLLRERIWRPAGMRHTSYPSDPAMRGPALHEDAWVGAPTGWAELDDFDPDFFLAAGAGVSTIADMDAFHDALLSGRLVSRSLVDQMLTWVAVIDYLPYGLGVQSVPMECTPGELTWFHGHTGATFGTLSATLSSADGTRQVAFAVTGRELTTETRWDINDVLVSLLGAAC